MVDLGYISRFWPQYEAWLSMQTCTPRGLEPTPAKHQKPRYTIVPTHNATESVADNVREMWSGRTPKQAHDALALDDVSVTNQKDKVICLPLLLEMDEQVIDFYGATDGHAVGLTMMRC